MVRHYRKSRKPRTKFLYLKVVNETFTCSIHIWWRKAFLGDKSWSLTASYLLVASGAVVMVLTSSTAELKSLMFCEE